MPQEINVITNVNVYGPDGSYMGAFEEVTRPEIKPKFKDIDPTDSLGVIKIPGTKLEPLTVVYKAASYNRAFDVMASNPFQAVNLQHRANMRQRDPLTGSIQDLPVREEVRGVFADNKRGAFKGTDASGNEWTMHLTYYRLVVSGREVMEIDIENFVWRVDGVDLLADFRQNMGID